MPKTTKNDRYNDIFPTRLRGMLKERNATHAALAAVLGVSNQAVSLYCNGGTQPKIEDIAKIARFLDVSTDYLFGLSDIRTTNPATKSLCESLGLSEMSVEYLKNDPEVKNVVDFLIAQHNKAKIFLGYAGIKNDPQKFESEMPDGPSIISLLDEFLTICQTKNDAIVSLTSKGSLFMEILHDGNLHHTGYASPTDHRMIRLEDVSIIQYSAKEKLIVISRLLEEYLTNMYDSNINSQLLVLYREIDNVFAEADPNHEES